MAQKTATTTVPTFSTVKEEGNVYFRKSQYTEALERYNAALKLRPSEKELVIIHRNKAACYLRLEKYDDVIKECSQGLALSSDDVKLLYRRAVAYERVDDVTSSYRDLAIMLRSSTAYHVVQAPNQLPPLMEKLANRIVDNEKEKPRARMTWMQYLFAVRGGELSTVLREFILGRDISIVLEGGNATVEVAASCGHGDIIRLIFLYLHYDHKGKFSDSSPSPKYRLTKVEITRWLKRCILQTYNHEQFQAFLAVYDALDWFNVLFMEVPARRYDNTSFTDFDFILPYRGTNKEFIFELCRRDRVDYYWDNSVMMRRGDRKLMQIFLDLTSPGKKPDWRQEAAKWAKPDTAQLGLTCLRMACAYGDMPEIKTEMVVNPLWMIEATMPPGILYITMMAEDIPQLEFLIEIMWKNVPDFVIRTGLSFAVQDAIMLNKIEPVKWALQRRDHRGEPLVEWGNVDVQKAVLDAFSNILKNQSSLKPLIELLMDKNYHSLTKMDQQGKDLWCWFHSACDRNDRLVVEFLLQNHLDRLCEYANSEEVDLSGMGHAFIPIISTLYDAQNVNLVAHTPFGAECAMDVHAGYSKSTETGRVPLPSMELIYNLSGPIEDKNNNDKEYSHLQVFYGEFGSMSELGFNSGLPNDSIWTSVHAHTTACLEFLSQHHEFPEPEFFRHASEIMRVHPNPFVCHMSKYVSIFERCDAALVPDLKLTRINNWCLHDQCGSFLMKDQTYVFYRDLILSFTGSGLKRKLLWKGAIKALTNTKAGTEFFTDLFRETGFYIKDKYAKDQTSKLAGPQLQSLRSAARLKILRVTRQNPRNHGRLLKDVVKELELPHQLTLFMQMQDIYDEWMRLFKTDSDLKFLSFINNEPPDDIQIEPHCMRLLAGRLFQLAPPDIVRQFGDWVDYYFGQYLNALLVMLADKEISEASLSAVVDDLVRHGV